MFAKNGQREYITLHMYLGEILHLYSLHFFSANLPENELSVQRNVSLS